MNQENVEAIRGIYERWGEGDFRGGVNLFDSLVLYVVGPEFPNVGVHLGTDAVAEFMRGFLEPWERITIEAEEIVEAGDSVVVAVWQRGVGAGSGAAAELRYFHVWSFRGGRVIRFENIRTRREALEAVGLTE
jgi:ketosteroid isomerase-like protein